MTTIIIVLGIGMYIIRFLFIRYSPVFGVKRLGLESVIVTNETAILDIRDYNVAYKKLVEGSVNIPLSYLNKYHSEINSKSVIIITSDVVGKNMSIRLLKNKGYQIKGYYLTGDTEKSKVINQFNDKGRVCHGLQCSNEE